MRVKNENRIAHDSKNTIQSNFDNLLNIHKNISYLTIVKIHNVMTQIC